MKASVFAGQPTAAGARCEPIPLPKGVLPALCCVFELSNHLKRGVSLCWLCQGGQAANEARLKVPLFFLNRGGKA